MGDVVAVATGQGCDERDARGVRDQVMLAARPAPVDGASFRLGSPFNARMWEPSTAAREKSRVFVLRSLARRTVWSWGNTPASDHSARRRQQVMPRPEAEFLRQVFPGNPGVQHKQDALEHKPVRIRLRPG